MGTAPVGSSPCHRYPYGYRVEAGVDSEEAGEDALDRASRTFGPNIHVEAGVGIIRQLVDAGRVDFLELSVTDVVGGEDLIDVDELLSHFSQIEEKLVSGTRFISAKK